MTKDKDGFPLTTGGNDQKSERFLAKASRNDEEGCLGEELLDVK